jgi:CBS domain-containing protein
MVGYENTSIGRVADIMIDNKIDCLPIVDSKDELIGIITSTDLLKLLRGGEVINLDDKLPFSFELKSAKDFIQVA